MIARLLAAVRRRAAEWWHYRQGHDIGHPLREIKAIELRDALAADISDNRWRHWE